MKIAGRDVYNVNFNVSSISAFDPFYKVRDHYETYIDVEGLFPWRFEQHIREGGYSRDFSAFFDQRKAKAKTSEGTYDIPKYVSDIVSAFYYARTFDYSKMKGMRNQIPFQQDAAGGHAWVLYSAYKKFGEKRYLDGAKSAVNVLVSQKESRFYEILLPFGVYTAARLNAENGTNYDVTHLLNQVFDGCQSKDGRYGWGIIAEKWGDYDVYGLQGSITDGGGYAFFMNSVAIMAPPWVISTTKTFMDLYIPLKFFPDPSVEVLG